MTSQCGGSWALVAATKRGDMDAFGELYRLHAPTVRRFLLMRSADRDLVDDLTSETFARALRHITRLTYQGKEVDAWLFTIARNALLDQQKKASVRREVVVADFDPYPHLVHDDHHDGKFEVDLVHHEIARCLATLSEEQRQCVVLRVLEDKSVKTTAAFMNRSPEAVRALHHRALRRLRAHMAGRPTSARVTALAS